MSLHPPIFNFLEKLNLAGPVGLRRRPSRDSPRCPILICSSLKKQTFPMQFCGFRGLPQSAGFQIFDSLNLGGWVGGPGGWMSRNPRVFKNFNTLNVGGWVGGRGGWTRIQIAVFCKRCVSSKRNAPRSELVRLVIAKRLQDGRWHPIGSTHMLQIAVMNKWCVSSMRNAPRYDLVRFATAKRITHDTFTRRSVGPYRRCVSPRRNGP